MTNVCFISHGRYRLLTQALESLYANTLRKNFNLTVVSDGEDDFRCRKILHYYIENESNFSLVEVANSSHVLAQLKNLAVFWSRQRFGCGDWLHLGDADVCFLPRWLDILTDIASASEKYGFRLWGGQIHPFHHQIPPMDGGTHYVGSVLDIDGLRQCEWTEHSILDGPSWFMRWKTWREFGPFNPINAPGPCQSEEFPFCQRLTAPVIGGSYREAERHEANRTGGRIGVVQPHVVIHTGLTNSNGEPAPGATERRAIIPAGVYYE
jgi:hypothetical protein